MRRPTDNHRVTSKFGWRMRGKKLDYHPGEDHGGIRPGIPGDPIYPIADNSRVMYVGYDRWRGNNVILQHNRHCTRYNHLNEVYVERGQTINEADILGRMGNTGDSTAAHLHFEVHECLYDQFHERWPNGEPKHAIDPELFFLKYLPKPEDRTEIENMISDLEGVIADYS